MKSLIANRPRTSPWVWAPALLLAGALLFLALRGLNWEELLVTLGQARPVYLAGSFLLLSFVYMLRGLRWWTLIRSEGPVTLLSAFWAVAAGYLGNCFLPARAGELVRCFLIGRREAVGKGFAFSTVLAERALDVVALVLAAMLAMLALEHTAEWLHTGVRVMALLGAAGVAALLLLPRLENTLEALAWKLPLSESLKLWAVAFLRQLLEGMRTFQRPRAGAGFGVLTILVWCIDALNAMLVARAFSLELSFPQAILLVSALGLSSALPSTPGYVGIYQFVAITVLAPFGFSREGALAFILAYQAMDYAALIAWGLLGIWRTAGVSPRLPIDQKSRPVKAPAKPPA